MFLDDPFNVGIKGAGVADCTGFVRGLVYITNGNGRGEFFRREVVLPDKLPVNTGDVATRIYQCGGVDDFEGV